MARRTPLLLAPALLAVGVWLLWPVDAGSGRPAAVRDPDARAPATLQLRAEGPALAGRAAETAAPAASETQPASTDAPPQRPGLPLRVTLVEAETGRILDLPWTPRHAEPDEDDPDAMPAFGAFERAAKHPTALRPATTGELGVAVRPGARDRLVAWDDALWQVRVSTYARALEAVYPLRTEARVRVVATTHDGEPVHRFQILGFRAAGRNVKTDLRTTPGPDGLRLHDVPFFRQRPLEVLVDGPRVHGAEAPAASEEVDGWDEEVLEVDGGLPFDANAGRSLQAFGLDVARGRAVLPEHAFEPVVVRIRFGPEPEVGGAAGFMSFSRGIGCGRRPDIEHRGDVVLTVIRRDGRPAVGAQVGLGRHRTRVGADGTARFDRVAAGTHAARLREPGLVSNAIDVEVQADTVTRVTLREAQGGSLAVRVLTPEGAPAPFASVTLPANTLWADLRDGVQRIDPYTDERGERTFEHLTPGEHRLTVGWGGLHTRLTVEVGAGHTPVTIKMPKPDGE